MKSQSPRLSKVQGTAEERTELYLTYCEGVPAAVTKQFAKSDGRVFGLAEKQASAAGVLR